MDIIRFSGNNLQPLIKLFGSNSRLEFCQIVKFNQIGPGSDFLDENVSIRILI
jgi:hypothetical protein